MVLDLCHDPPEPVIFISGSEGERGTLLRLCDAESAWLLSAFPYPLHHIIHFNVSREAFQDHNNMCCYSAVRQPTHTIEWMTKILGGHSEKDLFHLLHSNDAIIELKLCVGVN